MEILFLVIVGIILFSMNREVSQDVEEVQSDPQEPPVRKTMATGYGGCFGLAMIGLFVMVVALVVSAGG